MFNINRYVETRINADQMLKDMGNEFMFLEQIKYKGKPEKNVPEGITVTLQVLHDSSTPQIDKQTGKPKANNVFENFEVTIPGCDYPAPLEKGDHVALGKFLPEISYYIKYTPILRFGAIKKITNGITPAGGKGVA